MKDKNTLLLIGVVALYFLLRKKKPVTAPISNNLKAAKVEAGNLANQIIERTTFVPDETTFADMYKQDQKLCK